MKNMLILLFFIFTLTGCQERNPERVYHEIVINPSEGVSAGPSQPMDASAGQANVQWSLPDGWEEIPGAGMRVASFRNKKTPDAVDVSIVSLSGPAGGLEANLIRWANQMDVDLQSDPSQLKAFINQSLSLKTQEGFPLVIYDFRTIQTSKENTSKSIVAAMMEWEGTTVFVKMTGSRQAIADNFNSFQALSLSLRKK